MFRLREQAEDMSGVGVRYIEWSAPAGCGVTDRKAWYKANPALRAGFLNVDALATQAAILPEHEFRVYHLGQWVTGAVSSWLPTGAWDACPQVDEPPDGTEVVLGLAGTWQSSVAIVGATMDGALFVAYESDEAYDDELEAVFAAINRRLQVVQVVVAPRQRANLIPRLVDLGLEVDQWPNQTDIEVKSATEWRRAIVERRVAHDHHPLLAKHVAASVARSTPDGSMRLTDDGLPVDAARAARMAWWRAVELADEFSVPLRIY
jgi:phage terminase large subunit-like protein